MSELDDAKLGQLLAEQWDWRLIIAYIAGGLDGVIMGHYT